MGGISVWQLLIIVLIVVLLFGSNKLRSLGADLGASLKGFKKAVSDDKTTPPGDKTQHSIQQDADFPTTSMMDQTAQTKPKQTDNPTDKHQG